MLSSFDIKAHYLDRINQLIRYIGFQPERFKPTELQSGKGMNSLSPGT